MDKRTRPPEETEAAALRKVSEAEHKALEEPSTNSDFQDSDDNDTLDEVYAQAVAPLSPSDENKSEDIQLTKASRILIPVDNPSQSPIEITSPLTSTDQIVTIDSLICLEDFLDPELYLEETATSIETKSWESLAHSAKNYLQALSPMEAIEDFLAPAQETSPSPINLSPINLSPTYSMVSFYPFYGSTPHVYPFTLIPDFPDDCFHEASTTMQHQLTPSLPNPGPCIPVPTPTPTLYTLTVQHPKPEHFIEIHGEQEPIESPVPQEGPIELPNPEEPIESPNPEEPIESPNPEEPIESPNPEEPIESPNPEEPIESFAPEEPIESFTPEEPIELFTPKVPIESFAQEEPIKSFTPQVTIESFTPEGSIESTVPKKEPIESPTPEEPMEPENPIKSFTPEEPIETFTPEVPIESFTPEVPIKSITPKESIESTTAAKAIESFSPKGPIESYTPKQPIESITPAKPIESFNPEGPVESITPEEPIESSIPEEPIESFNPEGPVESFTPKEPIESTTPAKPIESITPAKPVESSTPEEPIESFTPKKPIESTNPAKPIESTTPAKPIESFNPEGPIESVTPAKPIESSTPKVPIKSFAPKKPIESITPTKPIESFNPKGPIESITPEEPIESPIPEEPIESPIPEEPIESPIPEEPIESFNPKGPIKSFNPKGPIESPSPDEPIGSLTPEEPIESFTPRKPIESPTREKGIDHYPLSEIEYRYSSLHEFPEWEDEIFNNVRIQPLQFNVELSPSIIPVNAEKLVSIDQSQPSILGNLNIQKPEVDIQSLQRESFATFTQETADNLIPGISGMKQLVEARSKTRKDSAKQLDFIDYFIQKDGYVYIGILEAFFINYYEKTKKAIRAKESLNVGVRKKFELARNQISQIYEIVQVNDEKELHEYDFPAALKRDIQIFQIDYMPKVSLIAKLHNYGIQMILHYVKSLTLKKHIDPNSIYKFSTELIADILVLCFGLFSKISDFLTTALIHNPSAKHLELFTLDYLIRSFRNLVDCICDEIGAIGQSCGQILIRIPNLKETEVGEVLTNIYKQVHYAFISIARAMESLAPALHLYYIKNFA